MMNFMFIVCAEPYKFEAIDSLLNLGKAILRKGHQIRSIFFYGSGVYNLKGDIHVGKDSRNIPQRLEMFCKENKVPIGGCSTWLSITGLNTERLIQGSCQIGLGEASSWIAEVDRLIVFGTGVT